MKFPFYFPPILSSAHIWTGKSNKSWLWTLSSMYLWTSRKEVSRDWILSSYVIIRGYSLIKVWIEVFHGDILNAWLFWGCNESDWVLDCHGGINICRFSFFVLYDSIFSCLGSLIPIVSIIIKLWPRWKMIIN